MKSPGLCSQRADPRKRFCLKGVTEPLFETSWSILFGHHVDTPLWAIWMYLQRPQKVESLKKTEGLIAQLLHSQSLLFELLLPSRSGIQQAGTESNCPSSWWDIVNPCVHNLDIPWFMTIFCFGVVICVRTAQFQTEALIWAVNVPVLNENQQNTGVLQAQ